MFSLKLSGKNIESYTWGKFLLILSPYFIFYILFYLRFSKLIKNSYKKPYFKRNKQKINIKFIKREFLLHFFRANNNNKTKRYVDGLNEIILCQICSVEV